MTSKRSYIEIDPDYEDVSEVQNKKRRVLEEGAKMATQKKIVSIIKNQFDIEVSNKETELLNITERLDIARKMMDRLRACIIANFYGNANQQKSTKSSSNQAPMIHPNVRKFIGKAPPGTPVHYGTPTLSEIKQEPSSSTDREPELVSERIGKMPNLNDEMSGHDKTTSKSGTEGQYDSRTGRFKVKKRIIVGNVSKSIPADQRDENDQATHKWMVYVRGPKDKPNIDDFVKKVWFFLHPSYRPNDLVEVSQSPFHLTRRGWGEFPVRVQLHFKDQRNKKLDIIHNLKLDRTYTTLQTLGSETVVDIEIEKDIPKVKREKTSHSQKTKKDAGLNKSAGEKCGQESLVTMEIKTEPAEDHDYGRLTGVSSQSPAKKQVLSNGGCESLNKTVLTGTSVIDKVPASQSTVQTLVSPSIITTQPLTLIPMGSTLQQANLHKLIPVTPPKNSVIQGQATSPGVTSPARNVVLKGFGSLSASNFGANKTVIGGIQNTVIQVSPTKSANSTNSFVVPQPVILTNAPGNHPNVQTGLPILQTSPQSKTSKNVNQSPNSNLVFLKCTDNQGKTYLIPQQLGTSLAALPKGSKPGQIKVTSPATQPVLLASNVNKSDNRQQVVISSNISPVVSAPLVSNTTLTQSVKTSVENGPVLFIKPDNNFNRRLSGATLVKSNSVSPVATLKSPGSVQLVQNVPNNQNVNILNLKTGKQTAVCTGNQSVVRGQLKVTSQGLIQVQGQLQHQQAAKTHKLQVSQNEQRSLSVNGGTSQPITLPTRPKQQPLILLPSNNGKMDLLQGKGKSLLNKSITNFQMPQANGNIIVLNQSDSSPSTLNLGSKVVINPSTSVGGTSVGKVVLNPVTSSSSASLGKVLINQTTLTSNPEQKQLLIKTGKDLPVDSKSKQQNHILIVPVSSNSSVAMETKGHTGTNFSTASTLETVLTNGQINVEKVKESQNKGLVVIQNDQNTQSCKSDPTQGRKVMSSLLGTKNVKDSMATETVDMTKTPVTIQSSGSREKKVIVMNNEEGSAAEGTWPFEKKIMLDPKKKRQMKPLDGKEKEKEIIAALRLEDFPDMLSLIQAAIKRHPLVSSTAGRHLHPYCARSTEEWLSWNIGKRRASEWQRATSVRRFLFPYLDPGQMYKGDTLWTVKQIITWCRLHAYSPHYIERPLHPTAIDLQAETSLPSDKHHRKFTSVTNSNQITEEVTSLQDTVTPVDHHSDEEIDIISLGSNKVRVKQEPNVQIRFNELEMLPLTEGAPFVEKISQDLGIKLVPAEVEPGYYSTVSHGLLYKAMELFLADVLRETFALKVHMGRYPDAVGITDVYAALNSLPVADFLTNKYLGVEEDKGLPKLDR